VIGKAAFASKSWLRKNFWREEKGTTIWTAENKPIIKMSDVIHHLGVCGLLIEEGPVKRTGALAPITSAYVRDPDGNLIEISNY
jgi:catechol 2,3-dioxygenase-like lactoylglutathione lyase family enzyme